MEENKVKSKVNKKAIGIIVAVILVIGVFYVFNSNVAKRQAFDEILIATEEEYKNAKIKDAQFWFVKGDYDEKYIEIECDSIYHDYIQKEEFDEKAKKIYYQLKDENITDVEIRFVLCTYNGNLVHRYIYR